MLNKIHWIFCRQKFLLSKFHMIFCCPKFLWSKFHMIFYCPKFLLSKFHMIFCRPKFLLSKFHRNFLSRCIIDFFVFCRKFWNLRTSFSLNHFYTPFLCSPYTLLYIYRKCDGENCRICHRHIDAVFYLSAIYNVHTPNDSPFRSTRLNPTRLSNLSIASP